MSDRVHERLCSCDDWAEFARVREEMGRCGTHGNPKPCVLCRDRQRKYDREREDRRAPLHSHHRAMDHLSAIAWWIADEATPVSRPEKRGVMRNLRTNRGPTRDLPLRSD